MCDAGDDTAPIPPREWLLGTIFCRRFLSSLVAAGGVGKSSLRIAHLLSAADEVASLCRRAVVMQDGKAAFVGEVREAIEAYRALLAAQPGLV